MADKRAPIELHFLAFKQFTYFYWLQISVLDTDTLC